MCHARVHRTLSSRKGAHQRVQSGGYKKSPPVLLYGLHQVPEERHQLFHPRRVGKSGILEWAIGCNEVGCKLRDAISFYYEQVSQRHSYPSRSEVSAVHLNIVAPESPTHLPKVHKHHERQNFDFT